MSDGRSFGEHVEQASVICSYCGVRSTDHRDGAHAAAGFACDKTVREVLLAEAEPSQLRAWGLVADTVKLRLWEGGPMIDLGADPAQLLASGLEALGDLAEKAPGYLVSPILARAVERIRKAREAREMERPGE